MGTLLFAAIALSLLGSLYQERERWKIAGPNIELDSRSLRDVPSDHRKRRRGNHEKLA